MLDFDSILAKKCRLVHGGISLSFSRSDQMPRIFQTFLASKRGAIVTDNQGHDLSYRTFINGVLSGNILIDTSQVATDTIDYVATDTWGNIATSSNSKFRQACRANPLRLLLSVAKGSGRRRHCQY